jgi:hypothetical protein
MNKFQRVLCGLYAVLSAEDLFGEELNLFAPSEEEAALAIHHGVFSPLYAWGSINGEACNRLLEAFFDAEKTDEPLSEESTTSWGDLDIERACDFISMEALERARSLLETSPPKVVEAFHLASVVFILGRLLISPNLASQLAPLDLDRLRFATIIFLKRQYGLDINAPDKQNVSVQEAERFVDWWFALVVDS